MAELLLVVFVAVVGLQLTIALEYLTKGTRPTRYYGTDLSIEEVKEAKKLTDHFDELSKALEEKLPGNADSNANLEAAKKMLSSIFLFLFVGRRKALKLFVSLENTVGGKCDLKSYKILAKNHEAMHLCEYLSGYDYNSRVADVLSHFRLKHAIECGPKYREMYKKKLARMNKDQLEMLKRDFSELNVGDFVESITPRIHIENPIISLASNKIRFSSATNHIGTIKPLSRIALQIGIQVFDSEPKAETGVDSLMSVESRAAAANRYLFEPCESYRNQLNDVLSPARFDAKTDAEIIGDDWEFADAIVYNRICGKLLEGRKMYLEYLTGYIREEADLSRLLYIEKRAAPFDSPQGSQNTILAGEIN